MLELDDSGLVCLLGELATIWLAEHSVRMLLNRCNLNSFSHWRISGRLLVAPEANRCNLAFHLTQVKSVAKFEVSPWST